MYRYTLGFTIGDKPYTLVGVRADDVEEAIRILREREPECNKVISVEWCGLSNR